MSDIKPGDLVMVAEGAVLNGPAKAGNRVKVVRPTQCCNNPSPIGFEFVVVAVWQSAIVKCPGCGVLERVAPVFQISLPGEVETFGTTGHVLIRIDPPALPEGVETTEELTA